MADPGGTSAATLQINDSTSTAMPGALPSSAGAAAAAAAAAADSSAMPPPPSVKMGPSHAPPGQTPTDPTRVVPAAAPSSAVAKTGLGTPSPLTRVPGSTQPAAKPPAAARPAAATGTHAPAAAAKATPVPTSARPAVPQPVLSSAPAPQPPRSGPKHPVKPAGVPPRAAAPAPVAAHHRPAAVASGAPHAPHRAAPPSLPPTEVVASGYGGPPKKKGGHPLRRGKWTSEEEAYAVRLIGEFKAGLLPLTDGTTLRNFLSKLLNCDPMRISKKFVGNNCIGKQVFRRRVADINRLTPEDIRRMRGELTELERRFFDRVAQTNRVKAPGVAAGMAPALMSIPPVVGGGGAKLTRDEIELDRPPTPPWLRPPASYKPKGKFAERLKARAAALAPPPAVQRGSAPSAPPSGNAKADAEKAMARGSSLDRLAQAASSGDIPRTESALEQLARTASAAKFVEDIVNGESPTLSGKPAPGGKKLSQATLKGSFEALMSMDITSVENLVELAASSSNSSTLLSDFAKINSKEGGKLDQSSLNLSHRMESFIKSLSSANLLNKDSDSTAALETLLANATSHGNIFDAEKFSKRVESSTGFSQLRSSNDGQHGKHNSVEDFLSLVSSGDIPHQDPTMLSVPLQNVMQQAGIGGRGSKRKLSQQRLVALANRLATGSSSHLSDASGGGPAPKKKKRKKKRKA